MKKRFGFLLLALVVLVTLLGINASFNLINQPDDVEVIFGFGSLGFIFLVSPWLFVKTYKKFFVEEKSK